MRHPFTGKGLVYYLMAWMALSTIHAIVLIFHYVLPIGQSITDAALFNFMMGGFGFSLWWAIQYITPKYQGAFGTITTFAALVVFGSAAVTFISDSLLLQFYTDSSEYVSFASSARIWKLLTGSLYLCMVILVYYLLRHTHKLKVKEQHELELQNLLKHSELEMLKFQINPHFIFNSLNSVSSLTITDPDSAREMVIKLSSFLRGSLGHEKTEVHTLEDELEQMNLYLDIEKVRFGDRLNVDLEAKDGVLRSKVPNMILQPLYENAIKFGVYEQLEAVSIETRCDLIDDLLEIRVSNNYDSNGAARKGKGIGLKNVRSRLELIYGMPDLVTIERGKDKFCVKLEIPQNQK